MWKKKPSLFYSERETRREFASSLRAARAAIALDLKVIEVVEGAADPVKDRQPGLGVRRQRGGSSGCYLVGGEWAAYAVVARARALSRAGEQTEVLAEAERSRLQICARDRLLAAVVAEEARHGVGRRLTEARRRRDGIGGAAERERRAEIERLRLRRPDHRIHGAHRMVMVHRVMMMIRGQAQRRRSQQRRLIEAVRAGSGGAAEAQRIRSHEIWRGGGGRRGYGHVRRRGQLLEQADVDADVIAGGTAVRGGAVAGRGRDRGGRRRAHQRIQAHYVGLRRAQLGAHLLIVYTRLLEIVDEVAAGAVRAKANRVEGAAQLGLVLRMARQVAQLAVAMRELTFIAVLTRAALLIRPAELRLVARRRLAHATVQFSMLLD